MRVIPAIDLHQGNCVRLQKGDFDRVAVYDDDPLAVAERFGELGVTDLHVVDLDGARTGLQSHVAAIQQINAATSVRVQVGGGIRSSDDVRSWLDNGASRCVIGSAAVTDSAEVLRWVKKYGSDRIVLALDVRYVSGEPLLATAGWTTTTALSLWDCIEHYLPAGLRYVLCTDIDRDGTLSGPATALYVEFLRRYPDLELQASGGIRNIGDLVALRDIGAPFAITGRALLDGLISRSEVASFRQSA
ncbi:MAG: 1-(5-phosphoribosyl)-5-[(5-phosphoribosylamino)methylideneamino]imidazole-4-carboxamide isomerase [Woeseiaceae bacterium]